jgi:hypothetical protein
MPLHELDAEPQSRSPRRRTPVLVAAALLIATASAVIANPQAGPQPAPTAPSASDSSAPPPPSNEVTSSIGMATSPARVAQRSTGTTTLPKPERHVLILLLGLCFIAMAAGVYGLWRCSIADLVDAKASKSAPERANTDSKLKN